MTAAGSLPRLAVTRKEAAEMLGVSEDTIRRAKNAGHLRAKKISRGTDGRASAGKELYAVKDLQAWFDGLADA